MGRPLREVLRLGDGLSGWWISDIFERHPSFYGPVLFEIFKLRAFERYMEGRSPTQIELYSKNKVLAQVLEQWCQRKGHGFLWHSRPCCTKTLACKRWWRIKVSLKNSWFGDALRLAWMLKNWWGAIRGLYPEKPKVRQQEGILVGTWFPNIDSKKAKQGEYYSRYWENAHELFKETKKYIHWFWIYAGPEADRSKAVALRNLFQKSNSENQDFTFWEECVTPLLAWKALCQAWCMTWKGRHIFRHIKDICQWPNSSLNFTPLLHDVWKSSICGWSLLQKLLLHQAIKFYAILIGKQKTCLTSTELQFWERLLFRHFRAIGTKNIYGAVHTRISPADFRYFIAPQAWQDEEFLEFMPDSILVNGEAAWKALADSGVPPNRLQTVEALRFMRLREIQQEAVGKPNRILVATSYYSQNNRAMLRTLAQAKKSSDLQILKNIIIKQHPMNNVEQDLRKYFEKIPELVSGPVENFLTAGTIVYTDSSTSVALLALYKNLPLIVHAPENNFDLGSLSDIEGVCFIRNSWQFLQALETCRIISLPSNYFNLNQKFSCWRRILTASGCVS